MTLGNWVDSLERTARERWREVPSWWHLLVVWPFVLGIVLAVYESRVDQAIASRQNTTVGLLSSQDPGNHNCFRYSFSVSAKSYSGCQTPRDVNAKPGRQVLVYYDPLDPSVNSLSSFNDRSGSALEFVPIFCVFIGLIVSYICWGRWRGKSDSKPQKPVNL